MSSGSAVIVDAVEPSRWDGLLRHFPNHTVFHTLGWLEIVRAVHGARIVLTSAHQNGECVGVWPYLELKKGPLRIIGSPLFGWSTPYMGPVFADRAEAPGVLRAFLDHKLFRRYAYFACKVIDQPQPVDLSAHGFSNVRTFATYQIDLTLSEEILWKNFKSECRTRIRKAQKLGLELKYELDPQFIDDYWAMSIETYQKSKIQPTHSKQFVEEMWKRLQPQGKLCALSVLAKGERIATLVLPFDDHTMYYWGGASYTKFRDLPAHNLLHWEAMRNARSRGLKKYDMISTMGGPGRFKRTFGPESVDLATHWDRSPSKVLTALKNKYRNYLLARRRVQV